MPNLLQEMRYALRGFRQSPVLAGAGLLSLALGIGANTAIFSLTDQVLLRSLPVRQPGQLVLFSAEGRKSGFVETNYDDKYAFSYPLYCDFRERAPGAGGRAGAIPPPPQHECRGSHRTGARRSGERHLLQRARFNVLGAGTVLGRPLTPDDDRLGSPNEVVVLSYNLWKTRFAMAPSVLNQTMRLNGRTLTIVGVAQPGFKGVAAGESADVFVPITLQPRLTQMFDGLTQRRGYWLNIFARLKPGRMPDNNVAAINASSLSLVKYFPHLGTVNLGLAVNPKSGNLYVANTDALNLVMFENNLNGHIVNHRITFVDPSSGQTQIWDLNPGINYSQLPNPAARATALAMPTSIVFEPTGRYLYVAAFGTDRWRPSTPLRARSPVSWKSTRRPLAPRSTRQASGVPEAWRLTSPPNFSMC